MDINKRVYNHRPGECRKVEGPEQGSEDFEVIDDRKIAFISSGVVYLPKEPSDVTWKGEIYLYDLTKRSYKAELIPVLNLDDEEGFFPHGLSHWILNDGTIRLFVVVHSKTFQHSIVILDYDEKKKQLNHVKTIKDDKFIRPNDIIATGENSFLVSNDGGAQTELGNIWEIFSGFYKGGVVYFDGKKSTYLLENNVANGIILSRNMKTLFVSHINQETIGVYSWDQTNVAINKISEIETLTGCDNFYIDHGNHLWTGCHPVMKDVVAHFGNRSDASLYGPSQVLRITFSNDFKKAEMVEVLADDGRLVCASTIAFPFDDGKQILVGTVGRHPVHCDVNLKFDFY
ncbi:hypothetical protein CAEBREN_14342 [Caenorhabditis brenneri]|uniref:SMP-30/Gluconolactonase/LRE-like region domain-containing protein n=1 Tax=Caenorhabditis brenneri TaxID=135651 RepID=G0NJN6_CAEBE|nr:hypothetical protein CAEBREN_14342 [Caenorhabditis brenneri]